jgi:hypothetical protein
LTLKATIGFIDPVGEQRAERAAEQRERQAVGQDLTYQLAAGGVEGDVHRHLGGLLQAWTRSRFERLTQAISSTVVAYTCP